MANKKAPPSYSDLREKLVVLTKLNNEITRNNVDYRMKLEHKEQDITALKVEVTRLTSLLNHREKERRIADGKRREAVMEESMPSSWTELRKQENAEGLKSLIQSLVEAGPALQLLSTCLSAPEDHIISRISPNSTSSSSCASISPTWQPRQVPPKTTYRIALEPSEKMMRRPVMELDEDLDEDTEDEEVAELVSSSTRESQAGSSSSPLTSPTTQVLPARPKSRRSSGFIRTGPLSPDPEDAPPTTTPPNQVTAAEKIHRASPLPVTSSSRDREDLSHIRSHSLAAILNDHPKATSAATTTIRHVLQPTKASVNLPSMATSTTKDKSSLPSAPSMKSVATTTARKPASATSNPSSASKLATVTVSTPSSFSSASAPPLAVKMKDVKNILLVPSPDPAPEPVLAVEAPPVTGRRRQSSAVSYKEPSLRAKMRKPGPAPGSDDLTRRKSVLPKRQAALPPITAMSSSKSRQNMLKTQSDSESADSSEDEALSAVEDEMGSEEEPRLDLEILKLVTSSPPRSVTSSNRVASPRRYMDFDDDYDEDGEETPRQKKKPSGSSSFERLSMSGGYGRSKRVKDEDLELTAGLEKNVARRISRRASAMPAHGYREVDD